MTLHFPTRFQISLGDLAPLIKVKLSSTRFTVRIAHVASWFCIPVTCPHRRVFFISRFTSFMPHARPLQVAFNSWLNEASIDAIVTLRSLPATDSPLPPSSSSMCAPDHRHQGPHLDAHHHHQSSSSPVASFECAATAAAAAASSSSASHSTDTHVYLGAGFSSASLATVTDAFVASLHALAPSTRVVLIVCVGGHHWVLLCWQRGAPLRLLDPMCSTAVDSTILLLAARLANDVGASWRAHQPTSPRTAAPSSHTFCVLSSH